MDFIEWQQRYKGLWRFYIEQIFYNSRFSFPYQADHPNYVPLYEFYSRIFKDYSSTNFSVENYILQENNYSRVRYFASVQPNARKICIIAPLSGHRSTLLNKTLKALYTDNDIYLIEWKNPQEIPTEIRFGLPEYINSLVSILQTLPQGTTPIAICQPCLPLFVASYVLEHKYQHILPAIVLIGGPLNVEINSNALQRLIRLSNVNFWEYFFIKIKEDCPGKNRAIYPGFWQLFMFVHDSFDRHAKAFSNLLLACMLKDEEKIQNHDLFYDEYNNTADLPAEFISDCMEVIYQKNALAKNEFIHEETTIKLEEWKNTRIMVIEGEYDHLNPLGQTSDILNLLPNLPSPHKQYYMQAETGHYGIFSGKKWELIIWPKIKQFIDATG